MTNSRLEPGGRNWNKDKGGTNNNHPGLPFGVRIMALGQDLLVHYDPQWAGSWLGGALAGISPTSPYTHHGTERAGSCGQEEFEGRGTGGGGREPAEREAILGT